jgi:S1-C subfamily serine protease
VRPGAVAAVALAAAVLGGLFAVVLADRADLADSGSQETVFVPSGGAEPIEGRPQGQGVKPLLGNGFDPAAIYRSRNAGVVTVYSYFDDRPPAEHAAQGSGFVVSKRGEILTSAHVVTTAGDGDADAKGANRVFVAFVDGGAAWRLIAGRGRRACRRDGQSLR